MVLVLVAHIVSGYYTTLLNSAGAAEFSPLPKPHNSTATSPIYLSQPSPFSISKGDCYGPRMKKIGWSLLHLQTSDWWQLVCDRCRVTPVTPITPKIS